MVNFYFIYFLLHVEELNFCFQFFTFNCNFDFFYQWWQIIKRNVVLFTKKKRLRVGGDERMIMSGLIYVCDRKSFTDSITCVGVKPIFFWQSFLPDFFLQLQQLPRLPPSSYQRFSPVTIFPLSLTAVKN